MAVNPYDPCPCGSGKKFKWCCTEYFDQIELALQQQQQGQHEAALRTMDGLTQAHGQRPQVWGYFSNILYAEGKAEEAEQALQKAFSLEPNFAMGHLLRGLFRQAEGELIGSLLLFRKAAEAYSPDATDQLSQVYEMIARSELMLNHPVACRAALERAVNATPTDTELREQLEMLFGPESRLPEVARKPYALRPTVQLLPAGAATGKFSDARNAYESLTKQTPDDPAAWFNLGLIAAWQGDLPPAVAALNKSVELEADDYRAEEAAALVEVLKCGTGMTADADYVEHRAFLQIRDPNAVSQLIQMWGRAGKLISPQMDESGTNFGAMVAEELPSLLETGTKLAKVRANLNINGGFVRLWHVNEQSVRAVAAEMREAINLAVGEPEFNIGPIQFGDITLDALAYPVRAAAVADAETKLRDYAANYFENTWLHEPVRSFGGASPLDAVGSSLMRKQVLGKLKFLEGCLLGASPRRQAGEQLIPLVIYDFNKLREKLNIEMKSVAPPPSRPAPQPTAPPPAAKTSDKKEIASLNAAGLSALDRAKLSTVELEEALKTAIKLDARELAVAFAREGVGRPFHAEKPDRYPFYACLMTAALAEGKPADVLKIADDAIAYDLAHNDGKQSTAVRLRKASVLLKTGDPTAAAAEFTVAIERTPNDGNLYVKAAEAMLGAKKGAEAKRFAEMGLAKGQELGNRDLQAACQELQDAAKRYS